MTTYGCAIWKRGKTFLNRLVGLGTLMFLLFCVIVFLLFIFAHALGDLEIMIAKHVTLNEKLDALFILPGSKKDRSSHVRFNRKTLKRHFYGINRPTEHLTNQKQSSVEWC